MKKLLIIFSALLFLYACNSSDSNSSNNSTTNNFEGNTPLGQASVQDDESAKNILQVAIGSKDHSTLVAAVQAANIEHILVNAGPLTVFAPVNAAFDALPAGTVDNLLKPENKSALAEILTRHATPGSFDIPKLKKEAKKGRKIYTATGDYLEVTVDGEEVTVGGAKVLASIQTSNGIINVVDKVILPAK